MAESSCCSSRKFWAGPEILVRLGHSEQALQRPGEGILGRGLVRRTPGASIARARASVTAFRVPRSWLALPVTVSTRLGSGRSAA